MIDTTYGQVRSAQIALTALIKMDMKFPVPVILRMKRLLGNLKPLVEQSQEMEQEIGQRHIAKNEDGTPIELEGGRFRIGSIIEYSKEMRAMELTPVTVGADQIFASDFGTDDTRVSVSVVEILDALGPFFKEDSA